MDLITDEIVEATARALRDEQCTGHDHGTSKCPDRHCRDDRTLPFYRARVRPALEAAAPLIAGRALREAADTWQRGEWADAPRRADRVQERIANGQHVGEWLRHRADRIGGGA